MTARDGETDVLPRPKLVKLCAFQKRLVLAQDLEIADLDLRAGDVQHTYVGQLSFSLRSPDGFVRMPIHRPGICSRKYCSFSVNDGDNFIGTRIDDASTNDLMAVGPTAAPFTGDWYPAFNSAVWDGPDPVRQMSGYNGRGTRGTWHLRVSDNRAGETGTLNAWSIIVTPVAYVCGP